MVLAERNSELVRNGRRSRGPSPNGHGVGVAGGGTVGASTNIGNSGGAGGTGTPETSSDDDNSIKRNGKSKAKQSEYEEKIRVGRDYQAVCPPLIPENDRKPEGLNDRALLVWSPTREIPDAKLEEYISVAKEKYGYNGEQALGMLFWHKHDLERAVMDLANFTPFPDEWTVEDKVLFEQAFQFHGKSFHRIRQMLPDKSIASLVKYYYSWKKTRHRQSVMDRQEKAKASKEGSENGSENGSNEESDTDDKDQALATTSGFQDQMKIGCATSADLPNKLNKLSENGGVSGSSIGGGDADSENTAASVSLNMIAQGRDSGLVANIGALAVGIKHQRQQTPPNTANTDSSCSNADSAGLSGCCTNCGVPCSVLNASPHGKLCSSCHHHWRRTGNKRPTSGPYFGKRSRDRNAERHKRKPPRGMYINHDDIVALARANDNQDELLANTDREIVSLLSQVQLNKQNISALKRKNSEGIDDMRPAENTNRINSRWSNDEALLVVQGVRKYGKDFQTIAETIGTKTEAHVRTFFVSNRRRYNLDQELKKYEAEKEEAAATATASATASETINSNNKKDESKKREPSAANATATGVSAISSVIADESDNTTSSEATVTKSTKDESKLNNSNANLQKDNVIMEIDLDADQNDMQPPAKKFALNINEQDFAKASAI
ncbi:PREDICTED: REST corepressor isoform X1 [Bactrocera latifrons]|uniref:REST corepressor isoform X1 n=1 Tax=Bactrocera latifrons TaxID=174628 RepID=UPI0008DCD43A|nr:PREDICTED: REST corepressor isoform X1 [Bactrocera latifrons]